MTNPRIRAVRRPLSLALALSLCLPTGGYAGDVPMPTGIECVRDCPGTVPKPHRAPSHHSHGGGDMKAMVVGTIFGTILGAALAPPPDDPAEAERARQQAAALAAQQLAEQQARAAAAQAAYDRMMQSYKQLNDTATAGFKSISDSGLGFKSLGSELDAQAAGARTGFDTAAPSTALPPPTSALGTPTAFFGDSMPMAQIRTLVEPANDPHVMDLRKAKSLVIGSVKQPQDRADQGKPAWTGPNAAECREMSGKLTGFIAQQNKFHQTILLANEQVDVWEEANRNALINAAKDGIEHFAGLYLDTLKDRTKAVERMERMYENGKARMLADGVDVQAVERRIARLRATTKAAGVLSDAKDWQGFVKDGMSAVLKQLNASNAEILADPVMQRYFTTESPELQTLLDISQIAASAKVFGKWVAEKMPIVAWTSFATNEAYNATDWWLSFQRLREANQINGRVTEAAKSLQRKINDTRITLKQCS